MDNDDLVLLRQILSGRTIPPLSEAHHHKGQNTEIVYLYTELTTIRKILLQFSRGNFDEDIPIRGAIAGCLKTLQANLRHLTWQVQQVAEGDFSQRVDFMGDFSAAFNSMVVQLERSLTELKESESQLLNMTLDLQGEIKSRQKVEEDLRQSEERWNLAVQCSRDGIWDMNLETKQAWYSDRFLEMFRFEPEDLPKDLRWDLFVHPEDCQEAELLNQILLRQKALQPFVLECRIRCGDGDYLWTRIRGMPVAAAAGPPCRIIGVATDISLQKETEKALAYQAMHDSLTGLPNRYLLNDRLLQHVATASRSGDSFILVTLDLDNFKGVNDTWGHAAGDILLVELGKRIKRCLRNTDTVARLGGDEFVFVYTCPKDMELSATEHVMTRLYNSFKETVDLGETIYTIRSSAGVAFFPKHATDIPTLFERADGALYQAKEKGKNTYAIWEPPDM